MLQHHPSDGPPSRLLSFTASRLTWTSAACYLLPQELLCTCATTAVAEIPRLDSKAAMCKEEPDGEGKIPRSTISATYLERHHCSGDVHQRVSGQGISTTSTAVLATSSRADRGTEATRNTDDSINQGFREKETAAEARTPPAMERNLFLSALANGKLEVMRTYAAQ